MSENILQYIKKDIPLIQEFMNDNIHTGSKMTGAEIYNALKDQLKSDVNENTFKISLSTSVRSGIIIGFEGKKSVGYIREGDESVRISRNKKSLREKTQAKLAVNRVKPKMSGTNADDDVPVDADVDNDEPRFCIQVSKSIRLVFSKNYIARQKQTAIGWVSQTYYSTLGEALKATVKYLLSTNISSGSTQVVMLKDLMARLDQIEASIMGELVSKVGNIPLDQKVSTLEDECLSA